MSMLGGGEMSESEYEAYQELERLRDAVREYLKYGSCDGRVERQPLRKQLAAMVSREYDESEARIKGK